MIEVPSEIKTAFATVLPVWAGALVGVFAIGVPSKRLGAPEFQAADAPAAYMSDEQEAFGMYLTPAEALQLADALTAMAEEMTR